MVAKFVTAASAVLLDQADAAADQLGIFFVGLALGSELGLSGERGGDGVQVIVALSDLRVLFQPGRPSGRSCEPCCRKSSVPIFSGSSNPLIQLREAKPNRLGAALPSGKAG